MENTSEIFNIGNLPVDTIKEIYGCMDAERLMNMCQTNSDNRDVIMKMCKSITEETFPEVPADIREQHTILLGAIANAIKRKSPSQDINTYMKLIATANNINFREIPDDALYCDGLHINYTESFIDIRLTHGDDECIVCLEKINDNNQFCGSDGYKIPTYAENVFVLFMKVIFPLFRNVKSYCEIGSQCFLEHMHRNIRKIITKCNLRDFCEARIIDTLATFDNLTHLILDSEFEQDISAKITQLYSLKSLSICSELNLPPEIAKMKLNTISVRRLLSDEPAGDVMKKLYMFAPDQIKSIKVAGSQVIVYFA